MENHSSARNVFIVEDSPPVRARLVEMLGDLENICIVGQAETPVDAVNGILDTSPDYVVLDFQLDGGNGVDVLRAIHEHRPRIAFIILTNHSQSQFRRLCMDAGAEAFFDKTTEFWKVRDVIAAGHAGLPSHSTSQRA